MVVFPHQFSHRVRFRECDPMEIAYHVHYLDWFEYARTEALREAGVPYKSLSDSGITLPVIDLGIKYKKSVLYDDVITVETTPELSESGMRLTCKYEILRGTESMAVGHVTLCFLQEGKTRPIPAPSSVRSALQRISD